MISIRRLELVPCRRALAAIPDGKVLINTINAFSYSNVRSDLLFERALTECDYLLPDGVSIVRACRWVRGCRSHPTERVTGWDLFIYEMDHLRQEALRRDGPTPYWRRMTPGRERPVVMFVGSTPRVLALIHQRAAQLFPQLDVVTYSPPYKAEFSAADSDAIIEAIHQAQPDLLWIGMTAPKQDKWTFAHWDRLDIHCHVGAIGAVFDFFAGTRRRAFQAWQDLGLEWL